MKRAVEVALDKLFKQASKKLGISGKCFYNVFYHDEDMGGESPNYWGKVELHYNVFVPNESAGQFFNLVNPILNSGMLGFSEKEPGDWYKKGGAGKTVLGFTLRWYDPFGADAQDAMENIMNERNLCARVKVPYDDAAEKNMMSFDSGLYPDDRTEYRMDVQF